MDIVEQQFADLQGRYPQATRLALPNGSSLITITQFPVPDGWNKKETTVVFLVPVGYPYARPDCFWADTELRLGSGSVPMNSGTQNVPNVSTPMLWFSFHPATWNANTDSLLTYTNVIRLRFSDRR
jgi:E2/UBC family protein E